MFLVAKEGQEKRGGWKFDLYKEIDSKSLEFESNCQVAYGIHLKNGFSFSFANYS